MFDTFRGRIRQLSRSVAALEQEVTGMEGHSLTLTERTAALLEIMAEIAQRCGNDAYAARLLDTRERCLADEDVARATFAQLTVRLPRVGAGSRT